MTATQATLVRSILKIGSGALVTKGLADDATAELILSGLMALIAIIWGVIDRRSSKPAEGAQPPTTKLLILALTAGLIVSGPVACTMTPTRATYTAEAATQVTVETAMVAWGDYVAAYHPPVDQERAVKAAFEKYQAAMVAAIDASQLYAAAASTSATNGAAVRVQAEIQRQAAAGRLADLVNLLQRFGVKTTTP